MKDDQRPRAGAPNTAGSPHVERLAHALAVLVRLEAEASVARRASRLRELGAELRRLVAGAVGLFLGGALIALAVVWGLATALRPWAAALIVGGAMMLLALMLVLPARRRLARSWDLARREHEHRHALDRAEREVRESAEALMDELVEQLTRREQHRLTRAAGRELGAVEHEAEELGEGAATALEELVEILTLPGRAGIDALRRITR